LTTQPTSPSTPRPQLSLPLASLILLGLLVLVTGIYLYPVPGLAIAAIALALVVAWTRPFLLFAGLLALIPLYDGLLRVVTWQLRWPGTWITSFSLWKEWIIFLLFAVLLVQHLTGRRRLSWRLYQFDLWLLALLVLSLAYVPIATRLGIGVYGLRNYLLPLAIFVLARLIPYTRRDLAWLLVLLTLVAAGVAAFGIYQARFIDFPTMIAMGYVDETGRLPFAFRTALRDGFPIPRAVSTATGPNQLALYLDFFILLCLFGFVRWHQPLRRLVLGGLAALFAICLLLTFSRGGLLALMVSIAAWIAIVVVERGVRRTLAELAHNRLLLAGLIVALVLGAAGLVASGFATRVLRGLTGRDPAADAHVSSMQYSVDFLGQHPMGIGMGMVGERALRFSGEAPIQHTESTYLQYGMETGLFGLLLLAAALVALLATLWRIRHRRRSAADAWGTAMAELAIVFWIGAMADFVVTPLLQNLLAAGTLWWIAGVAFHLDAYEA
jgi:hypothetical protein